MELFLASQSPRRAEILQEHGIYFDVIPNLLPSEPDIDPKHDIPDQVMALAKAKAEASANGFDGLILGVDTVVVFKDRILGKPTSLDDARQTLQMLSGYAHTVISAYALYHKDAQKTLTGFDRSVVEFYALTDDMIDYYITEYDVMDKAGAYGIQDIKDDFVAKLTGSYYNVMGLPIEVLLPVLENYDIVDLSL